MNKQFYMIGQMLNDEEFRVKFAPFTDAAFFYDEDLKKILEELKKPDFSFVNLYRNKGRELLIVAMSIANQAMRFELNRQKKL